jgi:hypothetical protein
VISLIIAAYSESYGSNAGGHHRGMLIPVFPIMIGVGKVRLAVDRGGRYATRRLIIGPDRHRGFSRDRRLQSSPITLAWDRRSCRLWCRRSSLGLAAFGFSWLQSATKTAARSWIRSRAFGSTSVSPRKTASSI